MRSGQGNPDEARAARYILKDYVNGKLLFCHPPPDVAEDVFNQPTHQRSLARVAGKKMAPTIRVGKDSDTFIVPNQGATTPGRGILPAKGVGHRSELVDHEFFSGSAGLKDRPMLQQNSKEFSRHQSYPHQFSVANDGTAIDPRRAKLIALAMKADNGNKHKKAKRVKQRSGKGYD